MTRTVIVPTPAAVTLAAVGVVVIVAPDVLTVATNVYGAVPPAAVKLPVPFVAPLQRRFISPVLPRVSGAGWVRVIFVVAVQPFPSVTVTP